MRVQRQKLVRIAGAVLCATVLAGCDIAVDGHGGLDFGLAAGQASDEWTRRYPLEAGARFELANVNGRIVAEAADGDAVEVRAERKVKATSDERAREILENIEMREEIEDGRVRVEVRAPRLSGPSSHEFRWTVRVPRGVSVDLTTVNGGVQLEGLDAEVRARTTNGGIRGAALAPTSLDAGVTNGGVDIEIVRPITDGTFELEAVNGGVRLNLPAESRADISGRCVNGGVSTSGLELSVMGEQTRRRLEAQLNGGGARVSLSTVNGGVRLGRTAAPTAD